MSVFENLYTQKYAELDNKNKLLETVENFNFYDNCMTTVLRSFKWGNLPDEYMPSFLPEVFLQYGGAIGFFYEGETPCIAAAFPEGKLTDSGTFSRYLLIFPSGRTVTRKEEECVIGYNNCFRMPYVYKINQYAERMSRHMRAVDAALDRAMFPTILACEDESQLKELGDYNGNFTAKLKTYLATLKSKFKDGSIEPINLFDNTKNDILALWDGFVRARNLFSTTFGINNVEIQKRERLTQAEGSGNDEMVRYTLFWDMFDNRKTFVEKVKEKFDYELEFEINRDIQTVYQLEVDNEEKISAALTEISKGSNIPAPNEGNNDTNPEEGETNENPGK